MTTRGALPPVSFTLNGLQTSVEAFVGQTLLELLRDDLRLFGTRENCGRGECGACTVLLDGEAVNSCLTLAGSIDGHDVLTIEGLGRDGSLDPIQEAFLNADASQCGFCTSGFIMASKALLGENPQPTREEIRSSLSGNYCRCTGYQAIIEAVASAASGTRCEQPGQSKRHVTGETMFLADASVPGTLHGVIVHLPVARARILSIDSRTALELPDVVRVFTAADFAESGVPRFGPLVADQPILASDVTRFHGEPVALVVAETEVAARAAASAVTVEYDELPPILTSGQAVEGDLIHAPESRPESQAKWADSNTMQEWDFQWGDPAELAQAEASADLVVSNRYTVPFAHHFHLEPYVTICSPYGSGVHIRSSIQHPFVMRASVARMLGLQPDDVRVEATDMGGGFGGKGYPKIEPLAAVCCRILDRPLKIALTADESFLRGQREAADIRIRTGFSADGDLLFQDIDADFLIGAYTDISPAIVTKTTFYALGPYRTPVARVQGRGLFTTTAPTTAFRGFGATHMSFAVESQMNQAAHRLGIDPLALRLRNARHRGDEIAPADTPVDGDWPALLARVAGTAGWDQSKPAGRGRGISYGMKVNSAATRSMARVHLLPGGRVVAYVGTTEMGQGQRDTMATLLGEFLGIPAGSVTIVMADTGLVPFDSWTASSRSTVFMGNALQRACENVKRELIDAASTFFGVPNGDLRVTDGRVEAAHRSVSIAELLRIYAPNGLIGEGEFAAEIDPSHPMGGPAPFYEVVATMVEIHLDEATGRVYLDRVVHGSDAGKVISRQRAERLDQGGLVMGQSLALSEALLYDAAGRLLNGSSMDYRIATTPDLPEAMSALHQEEGDGPGPFGAKGLAEGAILAIAPAICGAILDLTGIHVTDLPINPERMWALLQESSEEEANA